MIDNIIKREKKRFMKSIKEARGVVIKNHFSGSDSAPIEEYEKFSSRLARLEVILHMASDKIFKYAPELFEEKRGRPVWDVYLSGARYLARRPQRGVFFSYLASFLELENLISKVNSYLDNALSGLSDIYDLAKETDKYRHCYERAKELCSPYETEDKKFEKLCRIYANLKSWPREDEFQVFQEKLDKGLDQTYRIIIDGPIKLYLVIGKDTFFFIFRFLTARDKTDIHEKRRELKDSNDLHDFIYELIENSDETFRSLVSETFKFYAKNLIKELKEFRAEVPTDELKRRFVKRFENGDLFRD